MGLITSILAQSFSVEVNEEVGSPDITIEEGKLRLVRTYGVDWLDVPIAIREFLGYTKSEGVGFAIVLPHQDADFPWLWAKTMEIEPIGGQEDSNLYKGVNYVIYEKARLRVGYDYSEFDYTGSHPYVSENLEGGAEFLTIPVDKMSWDSAGDEKLEAAEAPGYLRKSKIWTVTFHNMPFVPNWIWDYEGKINSGPIISPTFAYEFLTNELLCGTPFHQDKFIADTTRVFDVSFPFTQRIGGWNKLMRRMPGGTYIPWDVYYDKNLFRPYEAVSFAPITP